LVKINSLFTMHKFKSSQFTKYFCFHPHENQAQMM
jgi:hypothetical protein